MSRSADTGRCFLVAVLLTCGLLGLLIAPLTSEAVTIEAFSVYIPSVGTSPTTDLPATFAIANLSDAGVSISQAVITAAPGLAFGGVSGLAPNPGYNTRNLPGPAGGNTGFTGQAAVTMNSVTLNFTGFDRLKVFSFSIDVDTLSNRSVPASAFVGSTLEVTFGGSVPTTKLSGTYYVGSPIAIASVKVSEPGTFFLLGSSLLAIGLAGRKRPGAPGADRLRGRRAWT